MSLFGLPRELTAVSAHCYLFLLPSISTGKTRVASVRREFKCAWALLPRCVAKLDWACDDVVHACHASPFWIWSGSTRSSLWMVWNSWSCVRTWPLWRRTQSCLSTACRGLRCSVTFRWLVWDSASRRHTPLMHSEVSPRKSGAGRSTQCHLTARQACGPPARLSRLAQAHSRRRMMFSDSFGLRRFKRHFILLVSASSLP